MEEFRSRKKRPSPPAYLLAGAALVALVAFGVLGVGRRGELAADHRYYKVAAASWLDGETPYSIETFERMGDELGTGELLSYAYPPNSFGIGVLLQLGPAAALMTFITLGALFSIALWCVRELTRLGRSESEKFVAVALVLGNPFSAHAIWTGNVSVVIVAAIVWAWSLRASSHWLAAGLLVGVAMIKPQLSLLPLAWLILERRWRTLAIGTSAALILAALPIAMTGWFENTVGWLRSVQQYAGESISSYGFEYVIGIRSLLIAAHVPCPDLIPVAGVLMAALFWQRERFAESAHLGLLLGISALFVYAHDYDLVLLAPLLLSTWVHVRTGRQRLLLLGAIVLICVPMRVLNMAHPPRIVLHWRTLVVLAFVLFALRAHWLGPQKSPAPQLAP